MKNFFRFISGCILVSVLAFSCSTESNTFINRSYHGTTARYNGYFNANELLRLGITSYRTTLKENYYEVLSIDPLPDEKEVMALYPAIDTAIVKCTKVIQNHSMPSNDRPAMKKEEHNPWIDENWLTIGKASFYRRDYDAALKNFRFIKKFYKNDPTLYVAELWIAKTNIELKNNTDAGFNLENLDKAIEEEKALKEANKGVSKLKSNKDDKEDKPAKFPKKIKFDLAKTKANLALKNNNKEDAIKFLKESLEFAKKKTDKARINFILGQLLEATGNREEAKYHYSKVLKYNANYELLFSAKIKRAFMGGSAKLKKELMKMLRDPKNAEYRDQIYYALADMEFQQGNKEGGKVNLTLCAFYSTTNTRQKGMAYEKLGNMSFNERNYISAQKYYDSCASVIPENYPNAEGIKMRVIKLADLVVAVERAHFEDSVQMIAKLSEKERIKFIENVIEETKKAEEIRKKQEARRLLELQKNQVAEQSGGGVNKWYWNNPKTKADGYDEFRRLWGSDRVNEDNWRRSEKIIVATFKEGDTTVLDSIPLIAEIKDTLTVDYLLKNIPLTDSAYQLSQQKMVEAYYNAGVIYKDQLKETQLAEAQFTKVLEQTFDNPFTLLSAFQLYKLFEENDVVKATEYKNYILNNYPNSDYANFLRDPEYFIKKKEFDRIASDEYLTTLERYNEELYALFILKASDVIDNQPENIFRAKYMLLKAMSIGMMNDVKDEMVPVLENIVKDYPDTEEFERAKELLKIIEKGVSDNKKVDFTDKSIYEYNEDDTYYLLVFLEDKQSSNTEKGDIVDFNREFYSRLNLKVSAKIFGSSQNVVFIDEFENEATVKEYVSTFHATRKHISKLHNNKMIFISKKNLKTLFETQKLDEYEVFSLKHF
jgi:tetratricopeptide (TPR) repeat protein